MNNTQQIKQKQTGKLRRKLLNVMERAALPVRTEQQRDLLHFVDVGGGQTGKFSFLGYYLCRLYSETVMLR